MSSTPRAWAVFSVLVLLICIGTFWHLTRYSHDAGFTQDDLMNTYQALQEPWPQLLHDTFVPWTPSNYYRPTGGVWYRILYDRYGWDTPLFHLISHGCQAIWLCVFYFAGYLLTRSFFVAALATALVTFLPGLSLLYFGTGFCYDWLCSTFWLLAMSIYIVARRRLDQDLESKRSGLGYWIPLMALFFVFYALALSSKELAVSLPPMIALYDLLGQRDDRDRKIPWKHVIPVWVLSGFLTLAFIKFRVMRPDGIGSVGGYVMDVSWAKYIANGRNLLTVMIQTGPTVDPVPYLWGFTAVLVLTLLVGKRESRWAALFCLIGVLPIAFIPQRDLAQVHLVLFGPAILLAWTLFVLVRWTTIDRRPVLAFLVFLFVINRTADHMSRSAPPAEPMRAEGEHMERVAQSIIPQLPKSWKTDARLIVFRQPFGEYNWGTVFLFSMLTRDKFLRVTNAPDRASTDGFDYAATFDGERLVELKVLGPEALGQRP